MKKTVLTTWCTPEQLAVIAEYGDQVTAVEGGHMMYRRFIVSDGKNSFFIKAHEDDLFTDEVRRQDTKLHLEKEAQLYQYLRDHGYPHLPAYSAHRENMLILSAMNPTDGWLWDVPNEHRNQYFSDTLRSLQHLESIPVPSRHESHKPALLTFHEEGWGSINPRFIQDVSRAHLDKWHDQLHPESIAAAEKILRGKHPTTSKRYKSARRMNHHDARQTNIAWHPTHGTVLVDWSWADEGFEKGDTTMFLIDILKSDDHVDDVLLLEYFNPEYAHMLFGHWLFRAAQPVHEGNEEVRFHQFVSAITALRLLYMTNNEH